MEAKSLATTIIVLMMAILGSIWDVKIASATPTLAQCQKEKDDGIRACLPVLQGNDPPRWQIKQCCKRVKKTHLECICPLLTSNIEPSVIDRAYRLAKDCGRKLPRDDQCESITIP